MSNQKHIEFASIGDGVDADEVIKADVPLVPLIPKRIPPPNNFNMYVDVGAGFSESIVN